MTETDQMRTIRLPAKWWRVIAEHLHQGKYAEVAPILTEMQDQVSAQEAVLAKAEAEAAEARPALAEAEIPEAAE